MTDVPTFTRIDTAKLADRLHKVRDKVHLVDAAILGLDIGDERAAGGLVDILTDMRREIDAIAGTVHPNPEPEEARTGASAPLTESPSRDALIEASYETLALLDASDRLLWELGGDDADRNTAIGSIQLLVKAAHRHVEAIHDHLEAMS